MKKKTVPALLLAVVVLGLIFAIIALTAGNIIKMVGAAEEKAGIEATGEDAPEDAPSREERSAEESASIELIEEEEQGASSETQEYTAGEGEQIREGSSGSASHLGRKKR